MFPGAGPLVCPSQGSEGGLGRRGLFGPALLISSVDMPRDTMRWGKLLGWGGRVWSEGPLPTGITALLGTLIAGG